MRVRLQSVLNVSSRHSSDVKMFRCHFSKQQQQQQICTMYFETFLVLQKIEPVRQLCEQVETVRCNYM